jgi:hypothetical protein
VDWPKIDEEVEDEEIYWQTLVDSLHAVAENSEALMFDSWSLAQCLDQVDIDACRQALRIGMPRY